MGRQTSMLPMNLAVFSSTSMSIIVMQLLTVAFTSAADLLRQEHVHLHQLGVVELRSCCL
eukprot:14653682-Heterocapsa_arctica.AAC.1